MAEDTGIQHEASKEDEIADVPQKLKVLDAITDRFDRGYMDDEVSGYFDANDLEREEISFYDEERFATVTIKRPTPESALVLEAGNTKPTINIRIETEKTFVVFLLDRDNIIQTTDGEFNVFEGKIYWSFKPSKTTTKYERLREDSEQMIARMIQPEDWLQQGSDS